MGVMARRELSDRGEEGENDGGVMGRGEEE